MANKTDNASTFKLVAGLAALCCSSRRAGLPAGTRWRRRVRVRTRGTFTGDSIAGSTCFRRRGRCIRSARCKHQESCLAETGRIAGALGRLAAARITGVSHAGETARSRSREHGSRTGGDGRDGDPRRVQWTAGPLRCDGHHAGVPAARRPHSPDSDRLARRRRDGGVRNFRGRGFPA